MNIVLNLLLAAQIISALVMIGLILIQHGKGADMGAAFGSGSSGSLFGASGSANFLSRATAGLATVFFACTLALAYFGVGVRSTAPTGGSVLDRAAVVAPAASQAASAAPAATGANAIPGGSSTAPAAGAQVPAPAPTPAASGAGQIPSK